MKKVEIKEVQTYNKILKILNMVDFRVENCYNNERIFHLTSDIRLMVKELKHKKELEK